MAKYFARLIISAGLLCPAPQEFSKKSATCRADSFQLCYITGYDGAVWKIHSYSS